MTRKDPPDPHIVKVSKTGRTDNPLELKRFLQDARWRVYDSTSELQLWQRIARREAEEWLDRFGNPSHRVALALMPIDGAELLCPACSSEARPDDDDTATCGTCGTLSPLDTTVAFSNFIHNTLHSGIRVRVAMRDGQGGAGIPDSSLPFPRLLVRVGSLLTMAAVAGLRRSQVDELLASQKALIARWVQKEIEEGDRALAASIPTKATGVEMAEAILTHTLGPLPVGFPNEDSVQFALEQVFHAASQYYKFRTTSTFALFMADRLIHGVRDRLGLTAQDPLPWKETSVLAKSLDKDARAEHIMDHYRGSEEALTKAVVSALTHDLRRVRSVFGRHRVTAQLTL